jgi:hypothetical protein
LLLWTRHLFKQKPSWEVWDTQTNSHSLTNNSSTSHPLSLSLSLSLRIHVSLSSQTCRQTHKAQ